MVSLLLLVDSGQGRALPPAATPTPPPSTARLPPGCRSYANPDYARLSKGDELERVVPKKLAKTESNPQGVSRDSITSVSSKSGDEGGAPGVLKGLSSGGKVTPLPMAGDQKSLGSIRELDDVDTAPPISEKSTRLLDDGDVSALPEPFQKPKASG